MSPAPYVPPSLSLLCWLGEERLLLLVVVIVLSEDFTFTNAENRYHVAKEWNDKVSPRRRSTGGPL